MNNIDDRLIDAAYIGNLKKVKRLLKVGADVSVFNNEALRWAAYNGHLEVVRELIKTGADPKAVPDLKKVLLKGLK